MAQRLYVNNFSTKLTAQLLTGGTTANISTGTGASLAGANGADWFIGTLRRMSGYKDVAREIVKITNRSTDALTIVRAQESTSALQFEVGDQLDVDFTAASMTEGRPGTTTNDSAAAGQIGEYISSTIAQGSAVALTTTTQTNITNISLTAGDWDVWFEAYFESAATTTLTSLYACISQVSATNDLAAGNFGSEIFGAVVFGAGTTAIKAGPARKSLASTTTIYAVAYSIFGASTLSCWGILRARRVR